MSYTPDTVDKLPEQEGEKEYIPCGEEVNQGEQKSSFVHKVTANGYVYLTWEMYGVPDKISVYVGGNLKWTSGDKVQHSEKAPIGFYYKTTQGDIEVRINEGLNLTERTGWKYVLYCPGTEPQEIVDKATLV